MVALLLVLLASSVPMAARGAADLQISADAGTEYDSNVFHESRDPKDDFSLRASARAALVGAEPRVSYALGYRPSYRRFFGSKLVEDVDHVGSGRLSFEIGPRTRLELNENVQSVRTLAQERIVVDRGGIPAVVVDDELSGQRTFRNRASASLVQGFGTRWQGSLSASHNYFDPRSNDEIRGQSMGGSLGGSYGWSAWNRFGASLATTLQLFEGNSRQPPSSTTAYQAVGSWVHVFDASTALSVSAGPALLVTRRDGFGVVPGDSSSRWTVFANGRLNRRWNRSLDSSLSYDRSQSDASGLGQSTIRDSVSFRTTWIPRQRWNVSVRGDWARRESTASTARFARGDLDIEQWIVSAHGSYRLTRRTGLTARLRYNFSDRRRNSRVEDFLAFVGVQYTLDPWRLWN